MAKYWHRSIKTSKWKWKLAFKNFTGWLQAQNLFAKLYTRIIAKNLNWRRATGVSHHHWLRTEFQIWFPQPTQKYLIFITFSPAGCRWAWCLMIREGEGHPMQPPKFYLIVKIIKLPKRLWWLKHGRRTGRWVRHDSCMMLCSSRKFIYPIYLMYSISIFSIHTVKVKAEER
jgi:hypothetical protein